MIRTPTRNETRLKPHLHSGQSGFGASVVSGSGGLLEVAFDVVGASVVSFVVIVVASVAGECVEELSCPREILTIQRRTKLQTKI